MGVFIQAVRSRIWIIVVTTIFTVAIVTFNSYFAEPTYRATAKLRVVPFGIGQPDYGTFLYFDQLTATISDILYSQAVAQKAKQQLFVEELPTYEIRVVPNSELLQLTVTAADAELAQRTANTLTAILLEQFSELYGSSLESIEASLLTQLTQFENEINALNQEIIDLRSYALVDEARIAELERRIASRQNTYDSLISSYNQAVVGQAVRSNLISIFEPATLPLNSMNRSLPFWIVIGLSIGLFGGVVLALLLESLQPRLYSDAQIEAVSGTKVLAHVPKIARQQQQSLFEQDTLVAESVRRLRSNLLARLACASHQHVMVAPTRPQPVGTVIAYNLALSMALTKKSVLLVDADMRHPSLHTLFGRPNNFGFSDLLRYQSLTAIQDTDIPGFDVVFGGTPAADSTELLATPNACWVLQELQQRYEILIFHGPPLLGTTDSLLVGQLAKNVVITIDAKSQREDVVTVIENLKHFDTNLLGIVVNDKRQNIWGRR